MRPVTKQLFLSALCCPALGWALRHDHAFRPLSLGERFRIDQGKEIERRARSLFAGGVLVDQPDPDAAAAQTKAYMEDPSVEVLFEASFTTGNFVTRADILVRRDGAWNLIEVKSGIRQRPEHIDDMAYTTMVLQKAGLCPRRISLMLISKEYRLGMPEGSLFRTTEYTEAVRDQAGEFASVASGIESITAAEVAPAPVLRYECRSCPRFRECTGTGVDHHIFEIPHLKPPRFDALTLAGITSILEIPPEFSLTRRQRLIVNCVQEQKVSLDPSLSRRLGEVVFPALYLDFEAFQTAIPLYPGLTPYSQIPTQYSLHCGDEEFSILHHSEYLADPVTDFRRSLAEHLLDDCEGNGSIIVYSPFEKQMIRGLAKAYPDLAAPLHALNARMVDLEAIIRKHCYHPAFHGSTSIKKTLPALVPEMSYEGMAIGEGDTAAAAFAYLALGRYSPGEAEEVQRNLLTYCAQDTLAMVKLHKRLTALCNGGTE